MNEWEREYLESQGVNVEASLEIARQAIAKRTPEDNEKFLRDFQERQKSVRELFRKARDIKISELYEPMATNPRYWG